jgi:sec-independent protein translocase protein TatB
VFNVGAGELLIILLVVLIVLGPEKLPDTARKIGNVVGEVRRMSSGFQNEMRAAIEDAGRTEPPRPSLEPVADETARTETGTDSARPQASDDSAA